MVKGHLIPILCMLLLLPLQLAAQDEQALEALQRQQEPAGVDERRSSAPPSEPATLELTFWTQPSLPCLLAHLNHQSKPW